MGKTWKVIQCLALSLLGNASLVLASDAPTGQPDTRMVVGEQILVGKWTIVSVESRALGHRPLWGQKLELEFTKDRKVIWRKRGKIVLRGSLRMDPTQRPPVLDSRSEDTPWWSRGIYRLEKNRLVIVTCQPNSKRPSDFKLAGNPHDSRLILERAR